MTKLFKGMQLDTLPVDQVKGSWRLAKNIVLNNKYNAQSNELGVGDFSRKGGPGAFPNKPVIGTIKIEEDVIYFFGTTDPIDSEIGIVRKGDNIYYRTILKDATSKIVLNFNKNFPISGVAEKKFNNNIIAVFTDRNDNPKILNIDCIPFGLEADKSVVTADVNKAKSIIKLFPDYDIPSITSLQVEEGQGALNSGVYYPMIAYELGDGSVTSFSKIYNGIPVVSDSLNSESTNLSGGQIGEFTSKAISIILGNVDTNYKRIRVGYLYVANGLTTAYYENNSFVINSTGILEVMIGGSNRTQLDLTEALTPNVVYSKIKAMTSLQGVLYTANVEQDSDFNYQRFANNINIRWVREKDVNINGQIKNGNKTYQEPSKVFFDKSFKSGECVALYIFFNLTNGTRTKGFHLPGRAFLAGDKDILNPLIDPLYQEYNDIDGINPIYKYQIKNTSTNVTATRGLMGFWENENELYPLDPNNLTIVHPDYDNIPSVTFSNRKVRHHVFPDLVEMSEQFLTGSLIGSGGSYPVNNLKSKAFGIEVSNVNIPPEFLPFVDSWEIGFAERSNANIRIIAQDCATEYTTAGGYQFLKFQPFDLMVSRPNLAPSYLKALHYYKNDGVVIGQEANFVEDLFSITKTTGFEKAAISSVTEFFYGGEGTTIPYPNTARADNIRVKTRRGLTVPAIGNSFDITATGVVQEVVLFDICIFRRNVYLNFNTQNIITTGVQFKITASGVQTTRDIYGGDVYINRYSQNPLNTGTKAFSWVVESASNIGLRSENLLTSKYFAPKYTNPTPSWFGYFTDYNSNNKFSQIDIHYPSETCLEEDTTIFRNRIPFSIKESTEGSQINWRTFKLNSYYESVKDKGEIWNIVGSYKVLYIHHKYSLFIAEIKDKFNAGGDEVYLGTTEIFDRPPREVVPLDYGFAGTQSQYACIVCRMGYCFIDSNAGKIFCYDGNSLKELSDQGIYNFILDNSATSSETDNPFIGIGYMMGYDIELDRLVITKLDNGEGGTQFTLSYSPELDEGKGGWVCFHDYYPNVIVYNRTGFYGINNTAFRIFKHNYDFFNPGKFYDGSIKESYIEHVETNEISKRFDSIEWISTAEKQGVNYPNETFSHLIVYNDTQCTEKINLKLNKTEWYSKDARNVEGTYKYNDFRDMVKDKSLIFIDPLTYELITSNINTSKAWYNKSQFLSKYCIFRLINDNLIKKNLHLSEISINFNKSTR